MELKEYQKRALKIVKEYLQYLSEFKQKNAKAIEIDPEMQIDFPKKAWEKIQDDNYISKKNGLGECVPNFYLKIPTGGGKTLLASHSIDLINRVYRKKQTGFVLWIVPTSQIYRQTFEKLRNRGHPYRQVLDISSGGRTLILEKVDKFTPLDVEQNLIIMLLMLPSANRQNKEVLKIFQDSGGFTEFFPAEDDVKSNEEFLKKFSNLDCFDQKGTLFGKIVKTSLGNTLRTLKPAIIIDEGHKAYSPKAQDTILNFNPSIIVELSATPPSASNKLVTISGQELNREEMIKLDMHITNKSTLKWQDVIRVSLEKRERLENIAKKYEENTGEYIRPICLMQVERTGKDQKGKKYIHSEDVKEYLIRQCSIPEDQIAIKSSEKDDIEGIDLFSKECHVRFIITKRALQEGWDCSFAYILTVLTNPSSQLGITQLVGRILRQPNARKTKVKELDESYVFCFRKQAKDFLRNVKKGFEDEGLGDIAGRVSIDSGEKENVSSTKDRISEYQEKYKKCKGKVYLPKFVIQEKDNWREVNYEMDIMSRIDWGKIDLEPLLKELSLADQKIKEETMAVSLSSDEKDVINIHEEFLTVGKGFAFTNTFITRQIIDVVPNPWVAYEIGKKAVEILVKKHSRKKVVWNIVFIIEELRKHLENEKDRLAEEVFKRLIKKKELWFFLLSGKDGYKLPSSIKVRNNEKALIRDDNTPVKQYLFSFVADNEFNDMERSIAIYLDEQSKLLWWYRNIVRQDYSIQGWKKSKIYPDFIFTDKDNKRPKGYSKVFVVETKGTHLKNEDTAYKNSVFDFCNKLGREKPWKELKMEFADEKFEFQVIYEEEWKNRINQIFSS